MTEKGNKMDTDAIGKTLIICFLVIAIIGVFLLVQDVSAQDTTGAYPPPPTSYSPINPYPAPTMEPRPTCQHNNNEQPQIPSAPVYNFSVPVIQNTRFGVSADKMRLFNQ